MLATLSLINHGDAAEDIGEWDWRNTSEDDYTRMTRNIALPQMKMSGDSCTPPVNYIIVIIVNIVLFHTCLFVYHTSANKFVIANSLSSFDAYQYFKNTNSG